MTPLIGETWSRWLCTLRVSGPSVMPKAEVEANFLSGRPVKGDMREDQATPTAPNVEQSKRTNKPPSNQRDLVQRLSVNIIPIFFLNIRCVCALRSDPDMGMPGQRKLVAGLQEIELLG